MRVNQVWSADITYIPMSMGYVYLISIIDWFSRYLLSWRLSNSLEIDFCLSALDASLADYHNPEIFNTDQGSQFTSNDWLKQLETSQIKISMDGKGRAIDNVFIERFFRSLKYEEVYLNSYDDIRDAKNNIDNYIKYYNKERPHQSLGYKTPFEVYYT
jgi:putative transposase